MAEIVGALTIGTTLQGSVYKYRVDKVLGQGAFGITYLCSTMVSGTLGEVEVQVAVKEFFAKELNSRDDDGTVRATAAGGLAQKYMDAFKRESQNLSKMKTAGIVNVLESFEANGTVYYSMEYLSGGTLDAFVRGRGMPERAALEMIHKIGLALAYMHGKKMMHLDLKPKNIMLRKNGVPILIDFGLSKQYESNGEPESSSTIGLGTPGFAPIEQANQNSGKEFQPTIDIYALGATMYEILTGKLPPTASEILNDGFPRQDLEQMNISKKTIDAVENAMSPVKRLRPQTVEAFLQVFQEAQDSLGEPSGDDPFPKMDIRDEETEVEVPYMDRRPSQASKGTLPERPRINTNDSYGGQRPSQGRPSPQWPSSSGEDPEGTVNYSGGYPSGGYPAPPSGGYPSRGYPAPPSGGYPSGGYPSYGQGASPKAQSQPLPAWVWPVVAVAGLLIGAMFGFVL